MIVKLTPEFIENCLVCPAGNRRIEYVDKGGTGLYVEVRATSPDQGTYYLRYKNEQGKTCHEKIGRTDDMDLDEARRRAKTIKAEITLGKDPRADEKASKAVPTLDAFFQDHYLPHAKIHNRGWKKKSQMYDLRLKQAFGNKRLDQIKRHDVSSFHLGCRQDGLSPATSDRYLALLRNVVNKAVEFDFLEKIPCKGVKQFNTDNRIDHRLSTIERQRLIITLNNYPNRIPALIAIFVLSSGMRLGEVLSIRHSDIDREKRLLKVAASTA